jgi:hypothetical protein
MRCQDNKSGESLSSLISLPRDFKFIFTLRRNAWFRTQLVAYFMFLVIVPAIVSSLAFQGATSAQRVRAPWQQFLPRFWIFLGEVEYFRYCATHKILDMLGLWA